MEKEKEFKCIKEFFVPKYNKNEEEIENESFTIPVDSVWTLSKYAYMSDVRLESDEFGWLEIGFDDLKELFIEINQNEQVI